MKKLNVLIFFLLIITSCETKKAAALKPDAFAELMTNEESLQLVDVRTPAEFQSGYLRDALLIDMFSAEFESRLETLNKDQPIAVYCAVGQRSFQVFELLQEKGFKEVYHLAGGLQAWQSEGKPIKK